MPPTDRKRRWVTTLQVKVLNPPIKALAARGLAPGVALLETIGRKRGRLSNGVKVANNASPNGG